MRSTIDQIVVHWRKKTLTRAVLNRVRKELGIPVRPIQHPLTELRAAGNAHLRELCRDITGTVLSIGEGHGRDKEGGRYRDYFIACDNYVKMEYDKDSRPNDPADLYGDVRSMPHVADASFDCVFCNNVLEHIDDADAAVAEIWRVLKPGGVLIFGMPLDYEYHGAPMDFWRYTEVGIRQLLDRFTISALLACGSDHSFTIDARLKFYGPPVQRGPLGYVGAAIKPAI